MLHRSLRCSTFLQLQMGENFRAGELLLAEATSHLCPMLMFKSMSRAMSMTMGQGKRQQKVSRREIHTWQTEENNTLGI
ncbi:hypothetical protein M5D96_004284 [Drosophila gunungcola]|uniref:Uncharacterized protein n=1 Tax=Drosophila gunungcola TaxID=103775 RepID=A0A9P9YU54_9MUSC|nr:hypothetical protein M5D96_004284 [Drosophila gunungcola]